MVDWSILTKATKYVGLEIIAVVSFILTMQEIFGIELNLNFIIYLLIVAVFIDAIVKLALNTKHKIAVQNALDSKIAKEYTIEQLQAELKKDKSAQEAAATAALSVITLDKDKIQAKIDALQKQLE